MSAADDSLARVLNAPPIVASFLERAEAAPAKPLLGRIEGDGTCWSTYGEISALAAAAASFLQERGIRRGDHVAVVAGNSAAWLALDLALACKGAVSVPLAPNLPIEALAELLRRSDARLAVFQSTDAANAIGRAPGISFGVAAISQMAPRDMEISSDAATKAARELRERLALQPPKDRDSLATILFTSGTAGPPKGVMLSHANLATNTAGKIAAHGFDGGERRLGVLPWHHVFGRVCDLYVSVVTGAPLVIGRGRESLLRDLQIASPSYLNATPYFFNKLAKSTGQSLRDLTGGRLAACLSGGAPLPEPTQQAFWDAGIPLYQGYGMTEASPVIADCTPHAYKRGTIGHPIPGVEIRLDEDGELLTRGPHVMLGYYRDDTATAAAIKHGWLHTGDLAEMDAGGFLRVVGRKKEMIALATGLKVSPSNVEAAITADPLFAQAVVFGEGSNFVVALLALDTDEAARLGPANIEKVAQRLSQATQRLSRHERPQYFATLEEPLSLERGELTAKGSVRRDIVRQRHAGRIQRLLEGFEGGPAHFSGSSAAVTQG